MSDYILHYGIKGQRHGKRRFQNEDGSLTEAGKLRYGRVGGHRINDNGEVSGQVPPHRGVSTAGIADASRNVAFQKKRLKTRDEERSRDADGTLIGKFKDKLHHLGNVKDLKKAQISLGVEKTKKALSDLKHTPLISKEVNISINGNAASRYQVKKDRYGKSYNSPILG